MGASEKAGKHRSIIESLLCAHGEPLSVDKAAISESYS